MRIEIDAKSIYERLKFPQFTGQDINVELIRQMKSGEQWKQDFKLPETPDKALVLGDHVGLPYPFEEANLYFERIERSYSGRVSLGYKTEGAIVLRDEQTKAILRRASQKMKEKYKELWSPIDDFGAGYVLSGDRPLIVINNQHVVCGHDICIGTGGAEKRKFSSLEDFVCEMVSLEKVTTNFVNTVFSAAQEVTNMRLPPDITLTLAC